MSCWLSNVSNFVVQPFPNNRNNKTVNLVEVRTSFLNPRSATNLSAVIGRWKFP